MDKSREIMELREKALADARAVADKAKAEKRNLSAEEQGQYDALVNAIGEHDKQLKDIADARNAEARDAELRQLEEAGRQTGRPSRDPGREVGRSAPDRSEEVLSGNRSERRMAQVRQALAQTHRNTGTTTYRDGFRNYLMTGAGMAELRAQTVGTDSAGGYTVPTEQFVAELIRELDNQVAVRRYARVIPLTNAQSLGVPTLDTDVADPTAVAETDEGSEVSLGFGKRSLTPRPMSSKIKISNTLMRSSAIPVDALIRERLGYKMGIAQEKGFMTGAGGTGPLGLFTASAQGISTGRDVATGNTTTAITYDGLVNCMMSMPAQYRASTDCVWVFSRTAVANLMKLKDGNGLPIFTLSTAPGNPNSLFGYPIIESEYAPSTFTAGLYVGLFGNLSYYWIAEALTFSVQRLDELYAEENSTGYIGRAELDGMPVLEEAFARVTLAP